MNWLLKLTLLEHDPRWELQSTSTNRSSLHSSFRGRRFGRPTHRVVALNQPIHEEVRRANKRIRLIRMPFERFPSPREVLELALRPRSIDPQFDERPPPSTETIVPSAHADLELASQAVGFTVFADAGLMMISQGRSPFAPAEVVIECSAACSTSADWACLEFASVPEDGTAGGVLWKRGDEGC